MLSIPVKLDLDAGAAEAALKSFEKGAKDALNEIVELGGKKINVDFKFTTSGAPVVKELTDQEAALKKVTDGYNRLAGGQAQSIGRTKKIIQQFKAERDALAVTSKGYKEASDTVKKFEGQLRMLQGIQAGSIADLKSQRAELIGLRDATAINSPEFKRLTGEIQKFDKQLAATKPKANSFVQAFAKIAIVSAGIQAVGGAIRSVTNAVDVYVRRTKDVEGFQLALENVGLAQGEVSRVFAQAETTASALGAPLAQVEQTYKRMVPALLAVGTSAADSDKFIENISARTQTLGLNTEQSGRLLEAFAQVLSKGKLQAEELNQQISELDGAFRVQFAEALGVTSAALNDLISNSQITADVFVKTVNKMENGVEALKKRIRDGTATIQQFQNRISTIETKNIEVIGAAIQPAIKAFLKLRLAVAEFIKEFSKSVQFEALVNIFNSVAQAAEQFASALLGLIGFIGELLSPLVSVINFVLAFDAGLGNLVTILVKTAAAIATVVLAIYGIIQLQKGIKFVQAQFINLAAAITGTGGAAAKATPSMLTYEKAVAKTGFAALSTAGKLKFLAVAAGKLALIAGAVYIVDKLIGAFTGAAKAAEEMNKRFQSIKLDFKDDLESLNKTLEETPEETEKLGKSLGAVTKEAQSAGEVNRGLGTVLGTVAVGAGLVAATMLTGGAALAVYAGAAVAGAAAANRLDAAKQQLEKSGRGRAFLDNQKEIGDLIKGNEEKMKAFGFEVGQVNFSSFGSGSENVVELSRRLQAQANTLKENIAANQELIRTESAKEKQDKNLIAAAKLQIQADKEKLALTNRSAEAASAYVVELIKQGDAATQAAASTEEMKKATDQMLKELDSDIIKQQTAAVEEYGKRADAANLLAAANIGIAAEATKEKIKLYERELEKLNEKEQKEGVLAENEKKRQIELTNLVEKETKKQAELGVKARDAVIDAFTEGVDRANAKVDTLGKGVSALKGAFDGVTDSLLSGLSAASGLIDAVVNRELQGLDEGSEKRKQIITRQLKAQAVANATENTIAQLKLRVQNRVAISEAKIAQLRLRAEAAIAAARGQSDLSRALLQAAAAQNQVIKGLQIQFEIESKSLKIQKQAKDQQLIEKGLSEQIGRNAEDVADKLGVQVVTLQQAEEAQKSIQASASKYAKEMGNAVVSAQQLKETAAGTVMDKAQKSAKKIKEALNDAKGGAEGLNQVGQAVNETFGKVEETGKRITGTLKQSIREANKLITITNGGSPARAMGGPVTGGQQYTVNDGGGREAFLSNTGKFSMLPAARNIQWTAPSSGTIISAKVLKAMQRNQRQNAAISNAKTSQITNPNVNVNAAISSDSGRLAEQISSAMSGSTSNRITNNVTIQSQSPVNDASELMTNVARMRLRNSRRF